MRLWHQQLISLLPRQQLLGQHRECCALRGKGWGRKHKDVDYVFIHPYYHLYVYHCSVMLEMINKGYNVDPVWKDMEYRGKILGFDNSDFTKVVGDMFGRIVYIEHNDAELESNLENLKRKEIVITMK